jgi:hypothetical protein
MDTHDEHTATKPLTPEQLRARAAARARKAANERRARSIRRRVAGGATALFAAALLGISVQLASGHDPALVAAAERREKPSRSLTASAAAEEATRAEETSSGSEESTSVEAESSTPSSVSTSQS